MSQFAPTHPSTHQDELCVGPDVAASRSASRPLCLLRACRAVLGHSPYNSPRRALSLSLTRPLKVYPIFAAVGAGCGLCVFHLQRHIFSSPDVRVAKSERALGVLEERHFFKEGTAFREHALRRCVLSISADGWLRVYLPVLPFLRAQLQSVLPQEVSSSLGTHARLSMC